MENPCDKCIEKDRCMDLQQPCNKAVAYSKYKEKCKEIALHAKEVMERAKKRQAEK